MRSHRLVTALAVTAAAALIWIRHELASAPQAAAAPPPASIASAAAPDRAVELELGVLRAKVANVESAAELAHRAPAAIDRSAAPDPPAPAPAEPAEVVDARLARIADAEPDDPAWSRATEAAIAQVVADAGAGSRVVLARCRSTLCRIEVAHDGDDARRDLLHRALLSPPFDGAGVSIPTVDPEHPDELRTVIYLARSGHELPN